MTRIRHQIPIPELDGTGRDTDRIQCGWYDCDNPASGLHTITECHANPGVRNHPELPARPQCAECRRVAFCSVQCGSYYVRSHRPGQFGKLPAGVNPRYFLT
jgi:hypothetical protein